MSMEDWDLWKHFHIRKYDKGDLSIPLEELPKEFISGDLRISGEQKQSRCSIQYISAQGKGNYGIIRRIRRKPAVVSPDGGGSQLKLCVKCPENKEYSLCAEALIQWYASNTLLRAGIVGAIPPVFDIYQYAGETRFTMEFIEGRSFLVAVQDHPAPDSLWIQVLAQAALLLGYLEETIRLDHRDFKADNVWIRERPIDYTLKIHGKTWRLTAPFQVVLLDFGFACLGGEDGNSIVNLMDGYLPTLDPCPKEGRDLFHLVASLWSFDVVRARLSPGFSAEIKRLLESRDAGVVETLERGNGGAGVMNWLVMKESEPEFRVPALGPVRLLERLVEIWRWVVGPGRLTAVA